MATRNPGGTDELKLVGSFYPCFYDGFHTAKRGGASINSHVDRPSGHSSIVSLGTSRLCDLRGLLPEQSILGNDF